MSDSEDEAPPLLDEFDPTPAAESPDEHVRVPLTIISGFLGAGKSTLLKRILTERHGYRIAVIMNEFGDTADIESKTINVSSASDPTADGTEEFLELANGCLCCSIKDSGVAAIEKLMQRKGAFDYILLETTGLANPGPIASIFWQNEDFSRGLGREITLDGVVCVVDAVFGPQQMDEDHQTAEDGIGESLRQIAAADVILLNKTDLVSQAQLEQTEDILRKINPAVTIHRTVRSEVDLKNVVNIGAYSRGPVTQRDDRDPNTLSAVSTDSHDHPHPHGEDHPHDHQPHQPTHYEMRGITSVQVTCPVLSSEQYVKLDEWIRTVLWEHKLPDQLETMDASIDVLRCKGLFSTDSGKKFVLQGVRNLYEMTAVDGTEMGVPEEGKLVLIGKGLDATVRASLKAVFR